jgi:hypothetical protein
MGRRGEVMGVVAVTLAVACSKQERTDEARPDPKGSTTTTATTNEAPAPEPSEVPRFFEEEGEEKVNVRVGTTFEVELQSPRNPGYKFEWLPAKIDHVGVDALGKTMPPPPKDVDGGSYRHLYRFRAKRAGTFIITIANTSAKSEAEVPTYSLRVRVEP